MLADIFNWFTEGFDTADRRPEGREGIARRSEQLTSSVQVRSRGTQARNSVRMRHPSVESRHKLRVGKVALELADNWFVMFIFAPAKRQFSTHDPVLIV